MARGRGKDALGAGFCFSGAVGVSGQKTRQRACAVRACVASAKPVEAPRRTKVIAVPHIRDWVDASHESSVQPNSSIDSIVSDDQLVMSTTLLDLSKPHQEPDLFLRAGPRPTAWYNPEEVRAAVVSCGGICPGINTVIREITECLYNEYGVRKVFGVPNGYRGFYNSDPWTTLTPESVEYIHKQGGSVLGSSRGGFEGEKIVDALEARRISMLFVIGGDGTIRGATKIYEECKRRRLKVSVVSVPKTIDNDIPVIDKSFGFETAVEQAQHAINAASVEASNFPSGVGLVKIMGRNSGFIAMHATLSSREVDCCLIPESPFAIHGPGGLIEYVERCLDKHGKMVMVVAEGAGQDYVDRIVKVTDASGNTLLADIGLYLMNELKSHFQKIDRELCLKYIDPTYMVRAVPANAADNLYCTMLAHNSVHGAFSGFTGFTTGPINGQFAYIPLDCVVNEPNVVDLKGRHWIRTTQSTGQPDLKPPPTA